jgi:hypothetical protein
LRHRTHARDLCRRHHRNDELDAGQLHRPDVQVYRRAGPAAADHAFPLLWGDEARLRKRFGTQIAQLLVQPRTIAFHFEELAPADVVEFWRDDYGPTQRAFEALASDAQKQAVLRLALEQLWTEHNRARDGGTVVESEYLKVLAVRA